MSLGQANYYRVPLLQHETKQSEYLRERSISKIAKQIWVIKNQNSSVKQQSKPNFQGWATDEKQETSMKRQNERYMWTPAIFFYDILLMNATTSGNELPRVDKAVVCKGVLKYNYGKNMWPVFSGRPAHCTGSLNPHHTSIIHFTVIEPTCNPHN